ncbi:uncharacterized protein MONBRDRAFT_15943, partial [Monosiga brevicollis MX1]
LIASYDIGIISGALLQLDEKYTLTDLQEELVVSLMLVGAIIASLVGGFIVDWGGRRTVIVVNAAVFALGAIILAASNNLGTLYFGRVVVGFAVSLSAVSEVIYISEIAPAQSRGALVSLNEMGITLGILVSYIINYALIDTREGWRYMFGISIVPAIIQGVGMLFLPRSPRWLLLRGHREEVRGVPTSLCVIFFHVPTAQIIETANEQQSKVSLSALLTDPILRKCLLIGCALTLLQQFTGQPTVLYYGSTLFKAAGFASDRAATLANMIIGIVKVLATAVALVKVDRLGIGEQAEYDSPAVKWTSLLCMLVFVIAYAFSYGPVSWLVLSELFPDDVRGRAVSIATVFNWLGNLLVSLTFLSLMDGIGFSGTFFLYAAIGVLAFFFVLVVVPETKGKSLEEVQEMMRVRGVGLDGT